MPGLAWTQPHIGQSDEAEHVKWGNHESNHPTLALNRVSYGYSLLKGKLMDHNVETQMGSKIYVWHVGRGQAGSPMGFWYPKATPKLIQPLKSYWLKEVPQYCNVKGEEK